MRARRVGLILAPVALLALIAAGGCTRTPPSATYRVVVPVTDLRAVPGSVATTSGHDEAQETQLLYGEEVLVRDIQDGWALIEAVEQPEYTHHQQWEGYPGWVRAAHLLPVRKPIVRNAVVTAKWATVWSTRVGGSTLMRLPLGAEIELSPARGRRQRVELADGRTGWLETAPIQPLGALETLSEGERRGAVLKAAEALLGDPYFWGGRSPSRDDAGTVTGVDCSGLVNLAYRAAGLRIPRDAHEQHLRARAVETLKPADLIFLSAEDDPGRIVHVMLYAGDDWLLEAPGTGETVRAIRVQRRLGRSLEELTPGAVVEHRTVRFGAYLP